MVLLLVSRANRTVHGSPGPTVTAGQGCAPQAVRCDRVPDRWLRCHLSYLLLPTRLIVFNLRYTTGRKEL